jgi:hypothetical protein
MRRLLSGFVCLFVLTLTLDLWEPTSFVAPILWAPVWVGLTIWSIIVCVVALRRRAWLIAALAVALPLLEPIVELATVRQALDIRDIAHFGTMRSRFESDIAKLPENGERFAEFNFGGMLFASTGVVYDETDEIGLPAGRQSAAWISRMKHTDLICGENTFMRGARHIDGHWYLTSFGC